MTTPSNPHGLSGLARTLVNKGLLPQADAEAIQAQAQKLGTTFVSQLILSRKFSALQIAEFAAATFGFPLLDLKTLDPGQIPAELLDVKLLQTRRIVPLLRRGTHLAVATADPMDVEALDDLKFRTSLTIDPIVVEDDKLEAVIRKITESHEAAHTALTGSELELELEFAEEPEPAAPDLPGSTEVDDAPVVKYLQKLLLDAINLNVSDIHIEPYEKFLRIRYRLDGILYEVAQPPLAIKDRIVSRIKVLSKLDISEKRVPQDGRMKLVLSKSRAVDFRISTLPTLYGEKIVLRILDPTSAQLGVDALGYEPEQKAALLEAIARPYGMILVTGPTGSGKTVSLYTCLNILNQPGVNVSTAEDPAEINLPGINQVNVNDRAGLTFATALKSFLRQDPDVIMVGEIRDLETADIAIKAAQTGHLVLSTLHTNDAPATLTRLMNMGVAAFNIASSVHLITAQRLARRLCACKRPVEVPVPALLAAGFTEADLAETFPVFAPVGCDACQGSGYKGRVGLYQVMPISEEMSRIIMRQGSAHDIADQARREGIRTLRQAGLLKVRAGITSLEEVLNVTNL